MSPYIYPRKYDVIVVGGGHAGIEAALAAARMGCDTLMLSINLDTIGQMSCNPAIGGLAKGHLAREIDALGGEMGKATDMTGLQFRMLNTKKGPSVRAPRAQCDKKAYQFRMKWICERQEWLTLKQGQITRILHEDGIVYGVESNLGVQFHGRTVVITTGTFLRGLMHIGGLKARGGRTGESAAMGLSESLNELGFRLGRLKTGTPPRLLKKSIDFSKTIPQPGDEPVPWFSYWHEDLFHVEHSGANPKDVGRSDGRYPPGSILDRMNGQMGCFLTRTTIETAELIRKNLHRSPLYTGLIEGVGPRYCPSIEDKIVRFADKESHQIFLEPEGISTDEFYVNGLSTSMPFDVQVELIKTIIGCENAEILRPAYAVEYDFVYPTQLSRSLEARHCRNLFLAGQINGTSGYEEAGAQGIIAGANAARRVRNRDAVVLERAEAYIGVLIDDLVTKGTSEPYRMFTSRAEYRLLLRQDNADQRLGQLGYDLGLLPARHFTKLESKRRLIHDEIKRLKETFSGSASLAQILRRPEVHYEDLQAKRPELADEIKRQVEIAIKYEGYIRRQQSDIAKVSSMERRWIPRDIDYGRIPSLRNEARQKLAEVQPETLGQASRISGISPADVSILMVYLKADGMRIPSS